MKALRFEWDARKALANLRKHGVSFEEAQAVFHDENALLLPHDHHSDLEGRFILLGVSGRLRILVVCHCYRHADETIRVISARRANALEQREYERRRLR